MREPDDDRERDCPACDASTPGEWDPVLRVYVCPVCSSTWRQRQRDEQLGGAARGASAHSSRQSAGHGARLEPPNGR
jgi:hypothetical protein